MVHPRPVEYPPLELVRRWARGRPAVRPRLGGPPSVYLLGPDANALIFGNDEWFSTYEAMKGLIPVDGPTSVVVSDGPDHARRRGLICPALAPRSVAGYLDAMALSAREAVAGLPVGVPVDAYPVFRAAIRRSTLRSLFGDLARDAEELGALLQPLLDLIDRLPQTVELHRRFRTPTWRRSVAARATLDAYIYDRIDAVAANPASAGEGILDLLVNGRDGSGSGLTREEIRDQAVTLIAAGYETTSAAMGWAVYALAHEPQWQERARAEARAVASGVDARELAGLTVLPALINESLRLYPPAAISARCAERSFGFGDVLGERGDLVIYSPYLTHRSEAFERADEFDPARWIGAPRPAPEVFLPFGGGAHRCIGSHLATTELTIMLAHLIAAGPFEASGPRPRASSFAAMRPSHATIVRAS